MSEPFIKMRGQLPNELAQAVSAAIFQALQKGMEPDEAACVVVAVATDYARNAYGPEYLPLLASVVIARAEMPEPVEVSDTEPA